MIPGGRPSTCTPIRRFGAGVARLGERGLTYDTWHYHYQNQEFAALARERARTRRWCSITSARRSASARTPTQREHIFEQWKTDIAEIAACENVVAKLGGLAMPDNGFGWNTAERPPTSDEFVAAQRRYYQHTIERFGPERCMFESNFPVDRLSLSYRIAVERVQEDDRRLLRRRTRRDAARHGGAGLPARGLSR